MIDIFDENFVILLCFIIFLYLSYRPVRNSVLRSLDSKIDEIKQSLFETEKIKDDAKALLSKVEKEIKDLDKKKLDVLENAKNSTKRLIENRNKEMDVILTRKKDSAKKSLNAHKQKIIKQVETEFADSVIKIVHSYLIETKNNYVSDKELLEHFIKINEG